jgi:hypothetical protein
MRFIIYRGGVYTTFLIREDPSSKPQMFVLVLDKVQNKVTGVCLWTLIRLI